MIIHFYTLLYGSLYEGYKFGYYDNLIYNWNTNPIKSIELSPAKDYEFGRIKAKKKIYKFYKWRDNYFKIEKLKNLIVLIYIKMKMERYAERIIMEMIYIFQMILNAQLMI